MPVFVRADIFFLVFRIAERYLHFEVLEVKSLEYIQDYIHHLKELILDLLWCYKKMRIILAEVTASLNTL